MAAGIGLARADDGDAIAAIYRPYVESTIVSFELARPDPLQMADRITRTLATHPWLVGEMDGRVVAYAYASRHRERKAYQWSADCCTRTISAGGSSADCRRRCWRFCRPGAS